MAQEIQPSGDKIYDPLIGEARDAFPGEVFAPEEEKSLNRKIREAKEAFKMQFNPILETGQLNPEEINTIIKAANIAGELKYKEILEAIRQNPANILQSVLRKFKPEENQLIREGLFSLDDSVNRVNDFINQERTADQMSGSKLSTTEYAERCIKDRSIRNQEIVTFGSRFDRNILGNNSSQVDQIFKFAKDLQFPSSDSINSFNELFSAVSKAGNSPDSNKPYSEKTNFGENIVIKGLPLQKPGLEGLELIVLYRNSAFSDPVEIDIAANAEAISRIIDKGEYTPYGRQF